MEEKNFVALDDVEQEVFRHSGLSVALIDAIRDIGLRNGAYKVILFGSRARGDYGERSDIDLAVYGINRNDFSRFGNELDVCPTLLGFDVVRVSNDMDALLLSSIEKDGVVIMEAKSTKLENYARAIQRAKEGINEYDRLPGKLSRDGVIQRFEFTAELAWKSCREYLLGQAYVGIDSPMSVIKTAYKAGLVDDEQGWIDLLKARNTTSQIYSDEQADVLFCDIKRRFVPLMKNLCERLKAEARADGENIRRL